MVTEENAENMQDVISQHFMQRMDFANPAQWHIIRYGLFLAHTLKVAKILKFWRIQWCVIEMQHLLHKPYVNEVTLNEQNL